MMFIMKYKVCIEYESYKHNVYGLCVHVAQAHISSRYVGLVGVLSPALVLASKISRRIHPVSPNVTRHKSIKGHIPQLAICLSLLLHYLPLHSPTSLHPLYHSIQL